MSLVKMSPSAWRYYAEEIAAGKEDYYAEGRVRGRWLGSGSRLLGIEGREVSAEELERLFGHGFSPLEGRTLGRSFDPENGRTVAGFALTFSVPKSVSALWALGGEEVAAATEAAQAAAARAALGFLERHAAFTRRGRGGVFQVDTDGLVVAAFTHRTSRAGDPQLHTHALVANKVRAGDGRWLSIDARELYEHQKAASMLYRAALRAELTRRLEVRWSDVDENGFAEITGVPERLIEAWSSRRHDLERVALELVAEREADLGRTLSADERAVCFQIAAYRTRAPKTSGAEATAELVARWRTEADELDEAPERWIGNVLHQQRLAVPPPWEPVLVAEAVRRLQDASATWTRADAVEALSTLVHGTSADAVVAHVERLADELLADGRVVSLRAPLPTEPPATLRRRDGCALIERHGAVRYTTTATLSDEAFVLELALAGERAGVARLDPGRVGALLAKGPLGPDQRETVRALTTGGDELACLVGPAGAGKSRSLDVARQAWEEAGYVVLGLAPSARAAAVLADEAHLSTETLARFLAREAVGSGEGLGPRHVVIVDEAAMARSDDLAGLCRITHEAGAKVVLVGDPAQLGAVGPGGLFATLAEDARGKQRAAELETVRRFRHAWEQRATLSLRARDATILSAYAERGRIEGGTREEMLDRAFALWQRARDERRGVVLMAGDNETTDELARRCRAERVRRGEVTGDGVVNARATIGVGDEVVTLRNERQLRTDVGDFVRNGERWRVLDQRDGALRVASLDGHGATTLPASYVREDVALSYALTIHKAQGLTTDEAVVLVDARMTGEQLYVAMSRGREENRALVVSERFEEELGAHEVRKPLEVLAGVLSRHGAERSAHEVMRDELSRYEDPRFRAEVAVELRRRVDELAGPDRADEIARLEGERALIRVRSATTSAERAAARAVQNQAHAESLLSVMRTVCAAQGREPHPDSLRRAAEEIARREATAVAAMTDAAGKRAALTSAEALVGLPELRAEQGARVAWLLEHPEDARFLAEFDRRELAEQTSEHLEQIAEHVETSAVAHAREERLVDYYGGPTMEELGFDPLDVESYRAVMEQPEPWEIGGPELGIGGPGIGL